MSVNPAENAYFKNPHRNSAIFTTSGPEDPSGMAIRARKRPGFHPPGYSPKDL
jgi:hypothetical protein